MTEKGNNLLDNILRQHDWLAQEVMKQEWIREYDMKQAREGTIDLQRKYDPIFYIWANLLDKKLVNLYETKPKELIALT